MERNYGKELFPEGGLNFRDLGGYPTGNGKTVRRWSLFRSGKLTGLTVRDREKLASLSVTAILDYQDRDEARKAPDHAWKGAAVYAAPALSDIMRARGLSADVRKLVQSMPQNFDGAKLMKDLYRELPFHNQAYKSLFDLLSDEKRQGGLVQHCSAGKDRTGVGSALTLLALNVPLDTVYEDYLATNAKLGSFGAEILERTGGANLPSETLKKLSPLIEARKEYLEEALNAILQTYGDFDAYFEREYGLTPQKREALCIRYLE